MRSRRHNILSCLVLVCYALSLTASGWFHDHHDGPCRDAERSCAAHASHASVADQSLALQGHANHRGPAVHSPTGEPRGTEDGKCPVCQFLSQRTMGDSRLAEVACATLIEQVFSLDTVLVARTAVACCQIRAPPCMA